MHKKHNGGRLPDFHRLDLSVRYTQPISRYTRLDITAAVSNAYNRENIFYFEPIRATRVNQLPLLPSLSLNVHF